MAERRTEERPQSIEISGEVLERITDNIGQVVHASQDTLRLAVLSLLLAEAELLAERGPAPPLLLLDDVLSELDERRRTALAERLAGAGQAFLTATGASALPVEPAQLVEVVPGSAR